MRLRTKPSKLSSTTNLGLETLEDRKMFAGDVVAVVEPVMENAQTMGVAAFVEHAVAFEVQTTNDATRQESVAAVAGQQQESVGSTYSVEGQHSSELTPDAADEVESEVVEMIQKGFRDANVGDANLDGAFDQHDIIQLLRAGKYLTGETATWSEGDFTADRVFDQDDVIAMTRAGRYEVTDGQNDTTEDIQFKLISDSPRWQKKLEDLLRTLPTFPTFPDGTMGCKPTSGPLGPDTTIFDPMGYPGRGGTILNDHACEDDPWDGGIAQSSKVPKSKKDLLKLAYGVGFAIGTVIDDATGASDAISDYLANNLPAPQKIIDVLDDIIPW